MAPEQSAVAVVSKDWINTAVRHLINRGQQSRSTGERTSSSPTLKTHRTIGAWLKNITTDRLRTDGSNLTMRFMIPWVAIVGLGVVDHGVQVEPGFAGGVVLEPADLTDQTT
jgi:hypothetical protein